MNNDYSFGELWVSLRRPTDTQHLWRQASQASNTRSAEVEHGIGAEIG